MTTEIQQAINSGLSSMQVTQRDVAVILNKVRQEKASPARQWTFNRSLVMAAAFVMLLAAVVTTNLFLRKPAEDQTIPLSQEQVHPIALENSADSTSSVPAAPGLSIYQLIEDYAVPIVRAAGKGNVSAEDMQSLIDKAEANGYQFSEELRRQFAVCRVKGNCDKAFLLTALARAGLGEREFLWSLEDQSWLDDIFVSLGLRSSKEYGIPTSSQYTQEQIVDIAWNELTENWEAERCAMLKDASVYRHGVQYVLGSRYGDAYWQITYEPLEMDKDIYIIGISNNGELVRDDTIIEVAENVNMDALRKRFTLMYGEQENWDQEVWQNFQVYAIESSSVFGKDFLCIYFTFFPDLPENAAEEQQRAIQLALTRIGAVAPSEQPADGADRKQGAGAQLGANKTGVKDYTVRSIAYLRSDNSLQLARSDGELFWKVWITADKEYYVEINAENYEVTNITTKALNDDSVEWFQPYLLQKVITYADETWVYRPSGNG